MKITWAEVQAGDSMVLGVVAKVSEPRPSRSGRSLMTVTFEDGSTVVKDPNAAVMVTRG